MIYSMITYDTHTPVKVGIDYTGGTTLQYGIKENTYFLEESLKFYTNTDRELFYKFIQDYIDKLKKS